MQGQTKIEGFFGKREPVAVPGPAASVEFPTEPGNDEVEVAPLPEYKEDEKMANKEPELTAEERAREVQARAQLAGAPPDMMTFFAENWAEFRKFVDENVHYLKDNQAAAIVRMAFNKPPELALVTMAVKLPPHAAQIQAQNLQYVIDMALPIFDARALKFPVDVVERGFGFFLLFLAILQELARAVQ